MLKFLDGNMEQKPAHLPSKFETIAVKTDGEWSRFVNFLQIYVNDSTYARYRAPSDEGSNDVGADKPEVGAGATN